MHAQRGGSYPQLCVKIIFAGLLTFDSRRRTILGRVAKGDREPKGQQMFVAYMFCKANDEGDPAGYVIATDTIDEIRDLDYQLDGNESIWFVPGTCEA